MKILIGTTSDQKIEIIKRVLNKNKITCDIFPYKVESGIVDQPIDEKTTIQGSINRALNAIRLNGNNEYDFAVGLEGGLCMINNLYYLVCIVSIADKNNKIFTGVSKKTPLPKNVSLRVENGDQFGEVIRAFEKEIGSGNADITELVVELISRTKSFSEAFEFALLEYRNEKYF